MFKKPKKTPAALKNNLGFLFQRMTQARLTGSLMKTLPDCDFNFLVQQTRLMLSSYRRWRGKSLWPEDKPDAILAQEVFFAPFVLCSAGPEEDPILNYGNQKALMLWEMDWATLTQTPGRHTAEPMEREERAKFLEAVKNRALWIIIAASVFQAQGAGLKSGRRPFGI